MVAGRLGTLRGGGRRPAGRTHGRDAPLSRRATKDDKDFAAPSRSIPFYQRSLFQSMRNLAVEKSWACLRRGFEDGARGRFGRMRKKVRRVAAGGF